MKGAPAASDRTASTLGEPARARAGARGQLLEWTPRPGVIVIRSIGHVDEALCTTITDWTDQALRRAPTHVFHDMEYLTSYDAMVRPALTDYARRNAARLASVNVLFRSRLVAMSVAVANMVLGGALTTFASRAAFEERIRNAR